jgi:hypothetical protein
VLDLVYCWPAGESGQSIWAVCTMQLYVPMWLSYKIKYILCYVQGLIYYNRPNITLATSIGCIFYTHVELKSNYGGSLKLTVGFINCVLSVVCSCTLEVITLFSRHVSSKYIANRFANLN